MGQDKETRDKLLQSARLEFAEKGYMKASLRNICKNAGVTTGALYFFFKDKEDLFEALTSEIIEILSQIMTGHYRQELQMAEQGILYEMSEGDATGDMEDSLKAIHQMYLRREDVLLVLTKSQGSRLEHIADRFVEIAEQHYRNMANQMQQAYPDVVIDDKMVHWMAHMQIDAFIYMITHIEDEKEATVFIERAITYMVKGWYGLFE